MGGEGGFGAHWLAALPIGDHAAGATDDGHERGDVPRVHDRVAHDVGPASRDEQVAVAVAPGTDHADAFRERIPASGVLVLRHIERIRDKQRGGGEACGLAEADGLAVERVVEPSPTTSWRRMGWWMQPRIG